MPPKQAAEWKKKKKQQHLKDEATNLTASDTNGSG
jgi:hypothetical protein